MRYNAKKNINCETVHHVRMNTIGGAVALLFGAILLFAGCPDDSGDTTAPATVTDPISSAESDHVILSWTNPADNDFDHIEISWDPPHNDGIKILTAAESGNAGAIANTTIDGLTSGTTYTFTIVAVDTSGNKSQTQTVTVTTLGDASFAAVTNVSSTVGDGHVTLAWTNPTNSEFDHIEIMWTPVGISGSKVLSATESGNAGETANTIIGDLTNDVAYTFIIVAVDTNGNKSTGVSETATPSAASDTTPPAAVTNVSSTAGDGQVTLAWTNPTNSDFDHIEITWTPPHNGGMETLSTAESGDPGSTVNRVISGLTNDTPYTFTVVAVDINGNDSAGVSDMATPSVVDTTPPAAVTNVSSTVGDGQVTLAWTNPTNSDFDHIEITWTPPDNGGAEILSTAESGDPGSTVNRVISGLTNDVTYTFAAVAVDTAGNSSSPVSTSVTPQDITPPSTITNIGIDAGNMYVIVMWTNPTESDFDRIEIMWTPPHNGGITLLSSAESGNPGENSNATISGLTNDVDYTFTVVAIDGSGNHSEPVSVTAILETDGDGVLDSNDMCPNGANDWTSAPGTDNDGDGCRDSDEDNDDDNDNYPDALDLFPTDASMAGDPDNDSIDNLNDVDDNNNGLIDIINLNMLNNIRHNLDGSGYQVSATDSPNTTGAATNEPSICNDNDATTTNSLCGYELFRDLHFDASTDYIASTINTDWRPDSSNPETATNDGFTPIGDEVTPFNAIFDGNSYQLTNLYVRAADYAGLFGQTDSSADIRNIGLIDNAVYGVKEGSSITYIGALAARNGGMVHTSYATGIVDGLGTFNSVGGLVGQNNGSIDASHTMGAVTVSAAGTTNNIVGGLVGTNRGTITTSYAMATVSGSVGDSDLVGGLVGQNVSTGVIIATYASGDVGSGGTTIGDQVGGLVGYNFNTVNNSYATGNVDGDSTGSSIGNLIGFNLASSTNNYASGTITSGSLVFGTHFPSLTMAILQNSDNSNVDEATPYYRWAVVPDSADDPDLDPDWEPVGDEKIAIYCDTNFSGSIESAEETDTNFIWDFGTTSQTPAITCTPGGAAAQR